MPSFYTEHFYVWGYAASAIALWLGAWAAALILAKQSPSLGIWILTVGALILTSSLLLRDVAYLIISQGTNVIDGNKNPRGMDFWYKLEPIEIGLRYLGSLAIIISLFYIGKDLREFKIQARLIKEIEQGGDGDAEEAV